MLAPAWIEVECRGVRHIGSGVIRYQRDVIAYLTLVRPAFQRVKGVTYRYVRRPRHAAIGAVGVEQLRIGVIRGVSCVEPDRIDPSVGRN